MSAHGPSRHFVAMRNSVAIARGDPYVQPVARKEDRALSRDLLTFAKAKRKYDRNAVLMTGIRMFG
jgi:hypothetical protein